MHGSSPRRLVFVVLAIVAALLGATFAPAQGGPEDDQPPNAPPPSGPDKADDRPPDEDDGRVSREELKEAINEAVEARIKRERAKGGLLASESGLSLWVGGGLELEYRGAQENHRPGTLRPARRAEYGPGFDSGWLFAEASYDDSSSKSSYQIAIGRIQLEATPDRTLFEAGYLWFNRPLTRFSIPMFKTYGADSLLVGLAEPFWKNQHPVTDRQALHQESFAEDERLQLLYTLAIYDTAYLIGGWMSGTRLALTGNIDESGNYPILKDDRQSYWDNRGTQGDVRRSPEFVWGAGVVIPTRGENVLHPKKPFSPSQVTSHTDVFHIGLWGLHGGLSDGERVLIDDAFGTVTAQTRRWRVGMTFDLIHDFGEHTGYFRAEYGRAADGALKREFGSIEGSFAFKTDKVVPMLRSVTPLLRWSFMDSGAPRAISDAGTVLGSAAERAAHITADRSQVTFGVHFGLHQYLSLIVEHTWNSERYGAAIGGDSGVDNDVWVVGLRFSF